MDKKIGEKSERRAVTEMGRPRIFTDEERLERRRAQKRAYCQRPEVKAQKRAYMKAYHQRPKVKAQKRAYCQLPEVKAQKRAYYKQREQIEQRRFACDLKKEPWELLAEVGYYDDKIKRKVRG